MTKNPISINAEVLAARALSLMNLNRIQNNIKIIIYNSKKMPKDVPEALYLEKHPEQNTNENS